MSKTVLVIGDTIIDHDVFCETVGLSLETPTLKTRFMSEEHSFGGAANVVNNLLSLGCNVHFITALADDKYAHVVGEWQHPNLGVTFIRYNGCNTVKSRYWVSRNDIPYKYLQINQGDTVDLSVAQTLYAIKTNIDIRNPDAVMLIDYRTGLFDDPRMSSEVIKYCHSNNKTVISSSQTSVRGDRYSHFYDSTMICMNQFEAESHMPTFTPTKAGLKELSVLMRSDVCVTLGSAGSMLYKEQQYYEHEGCPVSTVDTCGAGDAFLAAMAVKYNEPDLAFCNKWAAASTLYNGVYVPTCEDLDELN